jgi:hypothetical protein
MNPLALMIGCDKAATHARSALPDAPVVTATEDRGAGRLRFGARLRGGMSTLAPWSTGSRPNTTRGAALR